MHLLLLTVSFAIPTWTAVISPDIPSPGWGNPDSFCSNVYHREGLICESNPDSSSSQSCSAGSEQLSHASQAVWGCSQDEIDFWRDRFIKWSKPVKAFTESAKERSNCWSMLNSFQGTLDDQVGRKVGRFLDKSEVCTGKELANLLNAETAVALVKLYSFIPGCQGLHFSRLAPDSGFLHNPDVLRLLEPHARLLEVFAIYKLDLALFKIHTDDYVVQFNAVMGFLTTVVESVTEENPEGLPDLWNGNEGVNCLVWILSVLRGSPVMPASRQGSTTSSWKAEARSSKSERHLPCFTLAPMKTSLRASVRIGDGSRAWGKLRLSNSCLGGPSWATPRPRTPSWITFLTARLMFVKH